jgi:DNA-binding NarL/FixJ family response regulator
MRCIGEAGTGIEAIDLIARLEPAVALVDVGLPDMDGFDVVRAVVAAGVETRIVLISSRISAELVQRGFDAGAAGYLSKVSSVELLPNAVDVVMSGACYVDPEVGDVQPGSPVPVLDVHERRVLEQLAAGRDDEAIAFQLRLDVAEVAAHVDSLIGKLRCDSRSAVIDHAVRFGLAE